MRKVVRNEWGVTELEAYRCVDANFLFPYLRVRMIIIEKARSYMKSYIDGIAEEQMFFVLIEV
jgi:hypothetical protein